ncbi:MAG: transcriptional regulator [Gammaproteobacteria bacterium]|nr:transcriptional regulator [Gammaproteobacteria bacterium]
MVLTREFRETVQQRANDDTEFRIALLTEAAEALVAGESDTARALLRDYINATLGFENLARETGIAAKSLHRMFGPNGNPTLANLARVLRVLESREQIRLGVTARPANTGSVQSKPARRPGQAQP